MPENLPRLKASEIIFVLEHHGFVFIHQRGSHQKWRNPDNGKQVIVPFHQPRQLPLGTTKSIIAGSGIPEADFH
jgi:predicted RNA binding protein YcfA (HicA-like mRNA interferase family)